MRILVLVVAVLLAAGPGCFGPVDPRPTTSTTSTPGSTEDPSHPPATDGSQPLVAVSFRVQAAGASKLQVRFPVFWGTERQAPVMMSPEGVDFVATVELPRNALVAYEYGDPEKDYDHREQFSAGQSPVRYLKVEAGLSVTDQLYALGPTAVPRPARVFGNVTDAATGEPVLEPILSIDGILESAMNGAYEAAVRERPVRVTVFTMDGSYKTQSRIVTPGRADFALEPARRVNVTVDVAASPPEHHGVRLYATASQITLAQTYLNRFIQETYRPIGDSWSAQLHEDQWVDYLYTVGNAVLSFEHVQGQPVVRGFLAKEGVRRLDTVGSFLQAQTTTFRVHVPTYTDPADIVGIQSLDPRALHMHRAGRDDWVLQVSGRDLLGASYRYYRTWTGIGDERTLTRTVSGPNPADAVDAWKFQSAPAATPTFQVPPIQNRFQIMPFQPDWWSAPHEQFQRRFLDDAARRGLQGHVPAQVWGYERLEPTTRIVRDRPMTLYQPQYQLEHWTAVAHEKGLLVAITPQLALPEGYGPGHSFPEAWWPQYLAELERFNLHMARSAQAARVDYLEVVGASPFWNLPESYAAAYNAAMKQIVVKVRPLYDGKLLASYSEFQTGSDWWTLADFAMVLNYSPRLDGNATQAQIDAAVADIFASKYGPQSQAIGKPLILKIGVHSVDGAAGGREVPESDGTFTENNHRYPLDGEEQRMVWEAFLKESNRHAFVHAAFPFVFGFTVGPEGRDVDVRGKAAEALLSQWATAIG